MGILVKMFLMLMIFISSMEIVRNSDADQGQNAAIVVVAFTTALTVLQIAGA